MPEAQDQGAHQGARSLFDDQSQLFSVFLFDPGLSVPKTHVFGVLYFSNGASAKSGTYRHGCGRVFGTLVEWLQFRKFRPGLVGLSLTVGVLFLDSSFCIVERRRDGDTVRLAMLNGSFHDGHDCVTVRRGVISSLPRF